MIWKLRRSTLPLDKPRIMGILNVTPDSFSDGGDFLSPQAALARAKVMVDEGADLLDVGAESTRPGSQPISPEQERERLGPVLTELGRWDIPISVDTRHADTAVWALECGAQVINDISALSDPEMAGVVSASEAGLVLMHMLGTPADMQNAPRYGNVVGEVALFLAERHMQAVEAGVAPDCIVIDPGIGFGKTLDHNLALLRGIDVLAGVGAPVLVGLSRKRFVGELTGTRDPQDRLAGSLAAAVAAFHWGARIFRVHDVAATRQALDVAAALEPADKKR